MTPSEHIVNVALRMKLRMEGERLAVERAQRQLKTAQAEHTDCRERLAEAEAEYASIINLMKNSDDPDLLLAYLAKL